MLHCLLLSWFAVASSQLILPQYATQQGQSSIAALAVIAERTISESTSISEADRIDRPFELPAVAIPPVSPAEPPVAEPTSTPLVTLEEIEAIQPPRPEPLAPLPTPEPLPGELANYLPGEEPPAAPQVLAANMTRQSADEQKRVPSPPAPPEPTQFVAGGQDRTDFVGPSETPPPMTERSEPQQPEPAETAPKTKSTTAATPTEASGQQNGAEQLVPPRRLPNNPNPRYPAEAVSRRLEGRVLLRVEILPTGETGEVRVHKSSGHENLDRAAIAAVEQWRFSPATRGGTPVRQAVLVATMPRIHTALAWIVLISSLVIACAASAQETAVPTDEAGAAPASATLPTPFGPPTSDFTDSILNNSSFSSPPVTGYRAPSSTVGTLFDVPDLEFPGSTNVLPPELIADQQIQSFDEVVKNVPGAVQVGDGFFNDRFFLRGLEVRSRDFRKDGFIDPTFVPRDFANIERVEILKGPASVLYGSSAPSGTVNLITKKPVDDDFSTFSATFGSFDQQRYTTDVNGHVGDSPDLLFRFNFAYEDQETFRDFGYIERVLVAPSLTWIIDDDTKLTWLGEYHEDDRRGDRGVPAIGGDALAVPPENYVGEPANDFFHAEEYRQTLLFDHRFNDDWEIEIGLSSLFYEFPGSLTSASAVGPSGEPNFERMRTEILEEEEQSQSLITNLTGEFDTGFLHHRALFGMEFVYFNSQSAFNFDLSYPEIDVLNPTYTNPPARLGPFARTDFPVFRQARAGFYMQDLIELSERWQVLGGVRFDTVDFTYDRSFVAGLLSVRTEQTFNEVSPRAGIVYQIVPDDLSVYFSFSQSFNPPAGGGYIVPIELQPELGESFEVGLKADLIEGLSLNVVGEERSQGAELSLIGQITDRWSVYGGYAYTDTKLTDDSNPLIFGQSQRNVPLHSGNLWTRYNVIANEVRTVGLATGVIAQGERTANLAGTVMLPAFARWDAAAYYTQGRWSASLYVENLTDVHYAASSIDEFQIFPGAPLNARVQVAVTF
ncbi:Metal-pseudopaline receptor CntO [Durusdinium trenchii]|uniref:Metal-pseudopaline receptor CntO n=1 Tax=Durusdinium trenchii TaxID=1381693 RepID=A0ABP0IQU8_9DINO